VGVSACPCQKAGPVPSSWFFTTWTVCSIADPAGLLHPAADHGVHRVLALASSTLQSEKQLSFHDASPFEAFPSPAAIPLRIPTLLPLVIRRWPGFRVFLRWRVRSRPLVLPRRTPDAPLGFTLSSSGHHLLRTCSRWVFPPRTRAKARGSGVLG
jgi:hypothetical protein